MKVISCKEAVHYILKKEEGKLSFAKRLSLWRHLAICSLCKLFAAQNSLMNEAVKKQKAQPLVLTEAEKETIIRNVLDGDNE